jgi:hypothetical protein
MSKVPRGALQGQASFLKGIHIFSGKTFAHFGKNREKDKEIALLA